MDGASYSDGRKASVQPGCQFIFRIWLRKKKKIKFTNVFTVGPLFSKLGLCCSFLPMAAPEERVEELQQRLKSPSRQQGASFGSVAIDKAPPSSGVAGRKKGRIVYSCATISGEKNQKNQTQQEQSRTLVAVQQNNATTQRWQSKTEFTNVQGVGAVLFPVTDNWMSCGFTLLFLLLYMLPSTAWTVLDN